MRIYIETSVISFWYDRSERNRDKRRAARRLLLLCRRGVHRGFVSDIVRAEIEASQEPFRSRDLALVGRLGLADAPFDSRRYAALLEAYLRDRTLGRLPPADLQHLALYSASALEGLATFNLRHIANQLMLEFVRRINRAQGVRKELLVGPPEAFLPPAAV